MAAETLGLRSLRILEAVLGPGDAEVTIQDLELEHAELLPARETLCLWEPYPVNSGGPLRGCPPPPAGGCPPLPHAGASAGPNMAACPG